MQQELSLLSSETAIEQTNEATATVVASSEETSSAAASAKATSQFSTSKATMLVPAIVGTLQPIERSALAETGLFFASLLPLQ